MKLVFSLAALASTAAAKCACGYTVKSTTDENYALFTDLLETDFLHLRELTFNATYSTGWIPQNYNTTALQDQGPYGMAKEDSNLVPNFVEDQYDWAGQGVKGADPGLQLWVRSQPIGSEDNKMIPSAELVSERDDILYGSFRIAMKATSIEGTCAAFFFYRNNRQEIDLEILSSQQHSANGSWPVHFVVQNATTSADGEIGYAGSVHEIYYLPSQEPASEGYNEYRFDWLPGSITYYVNGQFAWSTRENVPDAPGRVHLSHWSNGNPAWSGEPPEEDAVVSVSYVKAYFNSSEPSRTEEWRQSCSGRGGEEMCEIPSQMRAPNPTGRDGNETGKTFFFSLQMNSTPGQVSYNGTSPKESLANSVRWPAVAWVMYGLIFIGGMVI